MNIDTRLLTVILAEEIIEVGIQRMSKISIIIRLIQWDIATTKWFCFWWNTYVDIFFLLFFTISLSEVSAGWVFNLQRSWAEKNISDWNSVSNDWRKEQYFQKSSGDIDMHTYILMYIFTTFAKRHVERSLS